MKKFILFVYCFVFWFYYGQYKEMEIWGTYAGDKNPQIAIREILKTMETFIKEDEEYSQHKNIKDHIIIRQFHKL